MSATPEIEILVEGGGWHTLPEAEGIVRSAIASALHAAALSCLPGAELTVILADDARLRALNADWRGKDKPTNVLTFPAANPREASSSPLLGDVVIAWETLLREAGEEGKRPADHLAHLVVHGTLHLFGFDHLDDREAEDMERLEIAALAKLGVSDPYKETAPA